MAITRKGNSWPQIRSTLLTGPEKVTALISTPHELHFASRAKTSPDSIRKTGKEPDIQFTSRITGERDEISREERDEIISGNHIHPGRTGFLLPAPPNLTAGWLDFPSAGGRTVARLSSVWHPAGKQLPGGPARQGATPADAPTWTRLRARGRAGDA